MKILTALRAYHVSYRIAEETTLQGTYEERYTDLTDQLKVLKPVFPAEHFEDEAHSATSSWVVYSGERSPEGLGTKLARNLTPGVDLLEVVEVRPDGRWELTEADPDEA